MQIILHYACSRRPCRFKHLRGHLDLSHYLDSGCSVMNKVFPTSAALAWWAFKVPLHSVCAARMSESSEVRLRWWILTGERDSFLCEVSDRSALWEREQLYLKARRDPQKLASFVWANWRILLNLCSLCSDEGWRALERHIWTPGRETDSSF